MIYILDFGSQTAHLIERRIRELGQKTLFLNPDQALKQIKKQRPDGIIFSGGPASVYDKDAPSIDAQIFEMQIPILGICYGMQLTSNILGGKVNPGKKEYGPALLIKTLKESPISKNINTKSTVWMSHGDEVKSMPKDFEIIGSTTQVPYAFVANQAKKIYGVQFHPEVEHTEDGQIVLRNFIEICGLKFGEIQFDIEEIKNAIKDKAGNSYVIGAISGGVDSTVAGILTADAIGKKFIPVYVENGLMREGTADHVMTIFSKHGIKPIIVDVQEEMLKRLRGIKDPERKRKIIGNFYIEVFEREMNKLKKRNIKAEFLMQGTIYSDVIESSGTKNSSKIKSHHNVGGLPRKMNLKLIEPLRGYYKDEVRKIGKKLKLNDSFVWRQPFPGPGFAVRIRGEVTKERLAQEKIADKIVLEELTNAKLLDEVFLSFPIMSGAYSTAVKGDGRFFGEVIAIRIIESTDVMTAHWSDIPYSVLQKISSRLVNEVPNISRVVYDITTKPPATMEWE